MPMSPALALANTTWLDAMVGVSKYLCTGDLPAFHLHARDQRHRSIVSGGSCRGWPVHTNDFNLCVE